MKRYVTIDKRSKKAKKEYYSKQRGTWGEINPVTRSVPSGKAYNRNKDKQKIGKSAENSVMDLMSIFCLQAYNRKVFYRLFDSFWGDIIVRFSCHGRKLLFRKNPVNIRGVGF